VLESLQGRMSNGPDFQCSQLGWTSARSESSCFHPWLRSEVGHARLPTSAWVEMESGAGLLSVGSSTVNAYFEAQLRETHPPSQSTHSPAQWAKQ